MVFKYIFVLICFFSINSNAQPVELFCKGLNTGTDIRTETHEFPMWVNFSPADFGGIRNFLVPACIADSKNSNNVSSCRSTSNELDCTCNNFMGTTMINLSRITGKLNIKTFFTKKESWSGEYYCDKITTKKF